jgi:hypothetical protein
VFERRRLSITHVKKAPVSVVSVIGALIPGSPLDGLSTFDGPQQENLF